MATEIGEKLTLHEELVSILRDRGAPMSTSELAEAVNARGNYRKRDGGTTVTEYQVHGRTRQRPDLFRRQGSSVSLVQSPTTSMNKYQMACGCWDALVEAARARDRVTYGEIAKRIGTSPRALKHGLELLQEYCLMHELPPLTVVAVSTSTNQPSAGFVAWDAGDLDSAFAAVYEFNWIALENPFGFAETGTTVSELASRLVQHPEEAADVYRLVKVRGSAQSIFRSALLEAYSCACAFCGLTIESALHAAHIVPWQDATNDQRMAVSNGLLLCATHHALFDSGLMTLDESGKIRCSLALNKRTSVADKHLVLELDGEAASVPVDPALRPSKAAIRMRQSSE